MFVALASGLWFQVLCILNFAQTQMDDFSYFPQKLFYPTLTPITDVVLFTVIVRESVGHLVLTQGQYSLLSSSFLSSCFQVQELTKLFSV